MGYARDISPPDTKIPLNLADSRSACEFALAHGLPEKAREHGRKAPLADILTKLT